MKILWLSHSARPGGAEFAMAEAVEALAARGHEQHVVLPSVGPLLYRLDGCATVDVCTHKAWLVGEKATREKAEAVLYNAVVAGPQLARLARRVGADVVVSNTLTAMAGAIGARRAGVPHVWFVHEFGPEDHGMVFVLGRRPTFRFMRERSDVCLTNSDAVARHLRPRLPGVEVRVARYAVTVPAVRPAPTPARSRLRLLLVGAKTPTKRQHDAVEALGVLVSDGVDAELMLVGGGDPAYEARLRELVAELGLADRVRFRAFDPDPFALMCDADVVLMCSRHEALGRVTVEAMKAGRPVVGAASGATPELVEHGVTGYLYRPGDPADLARWIRTCAEDPVAAREMGERGERWARATFNLGCYGEQIEAALERAVRPRNAARPVVRAAA